MTDKSKQGRASRRKGQTGERAVAEELRELLGLDIRRRVRNHQGEDDLTGLEGWSVEVKNCAEARLTEWWLQTITNCPIGSFPVLFYKLPRRKFRAVMPLSLFCGGLDTLEQTMETSLEGFALVFREMQAARMAGEQAFKNHCIKHGARLQ